MRYADFSFKKVLSMTMVFMILIFATGITYGQKKDYLRGFSISYYFNTIENTLKTFAYKYEFSNYQGNSFTASVFDALGKDFSLNSDNSGKTAKSLPVLVYHGITANTDEFNISPDLFKEQMFALKEAGYETVKIDDVMAFFRGEKTLPEKSFLLTFDDGRRDSFYNADPILQTLNYTAVMFVITKESVSEANSRSSFYLSKWELERVAKNNNWEIESHGRNAHGFYPIDEKGNSGHFFSNKLWLKDKNRLETTEEFEDRITEDMIGAKEDLENSFRIHVTSFAFPFGEFGQEETNFNEANEIALRDSKSIYDFLYYQIRGENGFTRNYPTEDSFLIKRIKVETSWKGSDLVWLLNTSSDKSLSYIDNMDSDNGWLDPWGDSYMENENLVLKASPNTKGSFVFLNGTYLWSNYELEASVNFPKGSAVALIAQYKDEKNYSMCKFTYDHATLEEKIDGKQKILAITKKPFDLPRSEWGKIGAIVDGNTISCLWNSEEAIPKEEVNEILSHGGIGFTTWGEKFNESELRIKKIVASPIEL